MKASVVPTLKLPLEKSWFHLNRKEDKPISFFIQISDSEITDVNQITNNENVSSQDNLTKIMLEDSESTGSTDSIDYIKLLFSNRFKSKDDLRSSGIEDQEICLLGEPQTKKQKCSKGSPKKDSIGSQSHSNVHDCSMNKETSTPPCITSVLNSNKDICSIKDGVIEHLERTISENNKIIEDGKMEMLTKTCKSIMLRKRTKTCRKRYTIVSANIKNKSPVVLMDSEDMKEKVNERNNEILVEKELVKIRAAERKKQEITNKKTSIENVSQADGVVSKQEYDELLEKYEILLAEKSKNRTNTINTEKNDNMVCVKTILECSPIESNRDEIIYHDDIQNQQLSSSEPTNSMHKTNGIKTMSPHKSIINSPLVVLPSESKTDQLNVVSRAILSNRQFLNRYFPVKTNVKPPLTKILICKQQTKLKQIPCLLATVSSKEIENVQKVITLNGVDIVDRESLPFGQSNTNLAQLKEIIHLTSTEDHNYTLKKMENQNNISIFEK